jgi:hypothetical protein
MGLLVDKAKPGGSGTSNDGNTARRFCNLVTLLRLMTFGRQLALLYVALHVIGINYDLTALTDQN